MSDGEPLSDKDLQTAAAWTIAHRSGDTELLSRLEEARVLEKKAREELASTGIPAELERIVKELQGVDPSVTVAYGYDGPKLDSHKTPVGVLFWGAQPLRPNNLISGEGIGDTTLIWRSHMLRVGEELIVEYPIGFDNGKSKLVTTSVQTVKELPAIMSKATGTVFDLRKGMTARSLTGHPGLGKR